MRAHNGILAAILILVASTGLIQCGNQKSKTANVEIFIVPEIPIVITADVTDGNGKKSTAPWFDFTMRIKNGSEQAFVVVAIVGEITITDSNGSTNTKTYAGDPGLFNYSNDTIECTYGTFGRWEVGEESYIAVAHANASCPNRTAAFRVDSLPKPLGASYRYRVKVQPVGYFIDDDDLPADRFEKFHFFYTQ